MGSSSAAAHPAYREDTGTCGPASAWLGEYGGGRILDITHAYRPELPAVGPNGLGQVVQMRDSMANGSLFNLSELQMMVHTGTHINAPGHMVQEHLEASFDVDTLDLDVLNGSLQRLILFISKV